MGKEVTEAQKKFGPKMGKMVGTGTVGRYPPVRSEIDTLRLVQGGYSIARFGDGELRLARNGTSISQRDAPSKLRRELREILEKPQPNLVVGIPNINSPTPKQAYWLKYATTEYTNLYKLKHYGSTWISRSDEAPWINDPEYWGLMRSLWQGRNVTLVLGTRRSLRPDALMEDGALSVTEVWGPGTEAYAEIDALEQKILGIHENNKGDPVLMCLGATATVLAARLARQGVWAIDLGHLGMFMRRTNAMAQQSPDLISSEYANTLREMHAREPWGLSGWKYVADVLEFYMTLNCTSILDYGSGSETLARDIHKIRPDLPIAMYDPGVPERATLPGPADLVTCTDVMEHIEPNKVDAVTDHILSLAQRGVFFVIALSGSKQILPDKRNAHIMIRDKIWWIRHLERWKKTWTITKTVDRGTKCAAFWLEKTAP